MAQLASVTFGDVLWLVSLTGLVIPAVAASLSFGLRSDKADTLPELAGLDAIYPELDSLYMDLHRNPELSGHEEKTAAKLATRLRALGYEVTERVGGYGVVAVLKNGAGPSVLVRTDMDALPIGEQTGLLSPARCQSKTMPAKQCPSCTRAAMTFTWPHGWAQHLCWRGPGRGGTERLSSSASPRKKCFRAQSL